ncbi:hypothetical protein ABLE93_09395 [Xanthobacter sp. KR7-65]|uniref:hypothetical protein n=1 Tax=Xanthobacter sp. KR7-65 TaxID=3156612 RepID=UPI0032B49A19
MQLIRKLAAASVALMALMALTAAASADTRIFIIDDADGGGVDACLASGAPCGRSIAEDWCRTHDYTRAIDFGRVAATGSAFAPTGVRNPASACVGPLCPDAVAITCSR